MATIEEKEMQAKQEEFQKKFGKHLKEIRTKLKVKQSELAGQVDMNRSHFSRLESGHHNPSLFLIQRICTALGISIQQFFDGFNRPRKKK